VAGEALPFAHRSMSHWSLGHMGMAGRALVRSRPLQQGGDGTAVGLVAEAAVTGSGWGMLALAFEEVSVATKAEGLGRGREKALL